jgi:hypothetical protein
LPFIVLGRKVIVINIFFINHLKVVSENLLNLNSMKSAWVFSTNSIPSRSLRNSDSQANLDQLLVLRQVRTMALETIISNPITLKEGISMLAADILMERISSRILLAVPIRRMIPG